MWLITFEKGCHNSNQVNIYIEIYILANRAAYTTVSKQLFKLGKVKSIVTTNF
jgi:hypothetical protein